MAASEVARTTPPRKTEFGTTLWACALPRPATSLGMESTAESKGEVSRDTSVCSAVMIAALATTGSARSSGMAAWPPRPRTTSSKRIAPAMKKPGREYTPPEGREGQTWKPKAAPTSWNTPFCCWGGKGGGMLWGCICVHAGKGGGLIGE